MSREDFLNRVRQAAQRGREFRVHLHDIPEGAGYVGARVDDVCAALAAEVDEVGGHAHLVESADTARDQLMELLQQYAAKSVLIWQHELLDRMELEAALNDEGIEAWDNARLKQLPPTEARAAYMAADVGITSCDVAVAESGSLLVFSASGQERITSLVTPVHIAVVERGQIVPDLFDARPWRTSPEVRKDDLPSNVSIITGPSKTGDIELTLTTGVHGPGKWHVIIIT